MFNLYKPLASAGFGGTVASKTGVFAALRNVSFLGHLQPNEGAVVDYKRLGRGPASGKGKTSGRGQKGQKARGKVPKYFEGGQTPFYKRFPIIGFRRPHRKVYHGLNLERIQTFWDNGRIPLKAGETLDIRTMRECGLITGSLKDGVKLLGNGKEEYSVPLNVEASKATLSSISTIEKAEQTYTSVYHTKLGLRAHVFPETFLLKKGYLPMQARPTHRRDIEYYSNAQKKGYLLRDKSTLLDFMGAGTVARKNVRKSELARALEGASTKTHKDFSEHRVVRLSDL